MLCTPNIVGPLSELNRKIRVQGQLIGATVTIRALAPSARVVAKDVAVSSDQLIDLIAGEVLHHADRLVVEQKDPGGDTSPLTPDAQAMGVQRAPAALSEIGNVGYETHLYECGECVWVSGAIPGAQVEVSFSGAVHGSGEAQDGNARFNLDLGLPGTPVAAHQVIPGLGSGPDTPRTPDPLPLSAGAKLPPPTIQPPLKACQRSVAISNVFDGARVTLRRSSGPPEMAFFDRSGLWFILGKALADGEKLSANQSFLRCERQGLDSPEIKVGPPTPVEIPSIGGKLCAGSTRVPVNGLIPGAQVHINVDATVFTGQTPPDRVSFPFTVSPLPANAQVTVKQERCGVFGRPSAVVKVDAHEDVTTPPKLIAPLIGCARAVSVRDVHPNALLQVFSKMRGNAPISDVVSLDSSSGAIAVFPYLSDGDDITVAQWACGGARLDSTPEHVNPHPPLDPPKITGVSGPVVSGDSAVRIVGAVPGAEVDVFVDILERQVFCGRGNASPAPIPTIVYLSQVLNTGDRVRAQQFLCDQQSKMGDPVTVVIPPPLKPVLVAPAANATRVAGRPTLSWNDPGSAQERKASSFQVEIVQASTTVLPPTAVTTTSLLLGFDLKPSTKYTWKVRGVNSTGMSDAAMADFTTAAPPPPPPPPPPSKPVITVSYKGPISSATFTVKGSAFLKNHAVHIRAVNTTTLAQAFISTGSDSSGTFTQDISFAVEAAGLSFAFSANDERPDASDLTGTLWSNTVTITAT